MRRTLIALRAGLGLLLWYPVVASAEPPDAVIELSGGAVAAGVGYTWGDGTLTFAGKRYPVKLDALSFISLGARQYSASGRGTGLKTVADINGTYAALAAGGTLGGGGTFITMQNQNGVAIDLISTSEGLSLDLATEGMHIALAE